MRGQPSGVHSSLNLMKLGRGSTTDAAEGVGDGNHIKCPATSLLPFVCRIFFINVCLTKQVSQFISMDS